MKNEKLTVNPFLTKDWVALRAYFLEGVGELPGLESGPAFGGIGSVTELATTKKEYKIWSFYDQTSWSLAEVLTVLT